MAMRETTELLVKALKKGPMTASQIKKRFNYASRNSAIAAVSYLSTYHNLNVARLDPTRSDGAIRYRIAG